MPKIGISLREFARRDGCSEGTVRHAVKQGKLVLEQDGSLDPTLIGSGWRKRKPVGVKGPPGPKKKARKSGAQKRPSGRKITQKETAQKNVTQQKITQTDADVDARNGGDGDAVNGVVLSFAEAQTRKEAALARLRELELKTKTGALVDANEVERTVAELSSRERDAWLAWPQSVAGAMALELNVDHISLARILDNHVRRHLAERSQRGPSEASA